MGVAIEGVDMTRWLFILCLLPTLAFSDVDTLRGTTNTWDVIIRQNSPYNLYDYGINTDLALQTTAGGNRKILIGTANLASVIGADRNITSMVLSMRADSGVNTNVSMCEGFKPIYEGVKWAGYAEGATCWEGWFVDSAVAVVDSGWAIIGCDGADDNGVQTRIAGGGWVNTGVDSTTTYDNNGVWANATNATSSDDSYATTSSTGTGAPYALTAYDFGFSIPTEAIIDTLAYTVEGYFTTGPGGVPTASAAFTKNHLAAVGTPWASGILETTEATYTYTNTPAGFGFAVTATEINSANFGIMIYRTAGLNTLNIDQMMLRVVYHDADRTATAMDTVLVNAADSATRFEFDIDTALANAWYTGTKDERGVALINDNSTLAIFKSSELTGADTLNRPLFIVTHESTLVGGGGRRRRLILEGD